MKRFWIIISIAIFLSTTFLVPASGATKAGTICKKLGQTSTSSGYKYTCIKSGKKLVWDRGVKIPVTERYEIPDLPTPNVTATSSNSFSVEIPVIEGFDFNKVSLELNFTDGMSGICANKIAITELPFRTFCSGANKTSFAVYLSASGKLGQSVSGFKSSGIATVLLPILPTPTPTPTITSTATSMKI